MSGRKHIWLSVAMAFILFISMCMAIAGGFPLAAAGEEMQENPDVLPVNHVLGEPDIPVTDNGTMVGITIVDETTDLSYPVGADTDEDFYPENKNWNGIPTVVQAGNNIFVAYYTGGEGEPDDNNYISIAASDDLGKTWQNPWMIIHASPRGLVWPLFFYNGDGDLCMTYGDNKMTGTQMIRFFNEDGPLDGIRYSAPVKTGPPVSIGCKPTLLSDGTLISAYGTTLSFDVADTIIIRSEDGGRSFRNQATVTSTVDNEYRMYAETSIVEKKDGTLWLLRRLENGMGIEQSFSYDNGRTWTTATNDLPVPPFYSPGSRFYMARLASGNLLFVTNMQGRGTDRRDMTVWLSEDDGDTWPYSLQLDPTQSSYPDFFQGDDGTIYLVHDRDRYGEGGIRLHMFTEEDVKAGKFISDKARQGIIITQKDSEYGDIVSVNGAYQWTETYPLGTELSEILANKPTTITVTDDKGKDYELEGKYRVAGYDKDTPGVYTAYFLPDGAMPAKLKDGFNCLRFEIVVEGGNTPVWVIVVPIVAGVAVLTAAGTAIAVLHNRKKNKEETGK